MLGKMIACSMVGFLVLQSPKPPETAYDSKRDITTYSTGDVHSAGYSGYSAHFDFPGKTPSVPSAVSIGFGSLRLTHGASPDQDEKLLHWHDVKMVSITFDGKTHQYPAEHDFHVSTNKQVKMFLGRALEESLSITLTPDQFKELAAPDSLQVQLGDDVEVIKGKSLGPLKKLAACLPAQKATLRRVDTTSSRLQITAMSDPGYSGLAPSEPWAMLRNRIAVTGPEGTMCCLAAVVRLDA